MRFKTDFGVESEGMRVEKEKSFFRSRRVDKESYLNLELRVKNYSRFAAIYN